MNKLIFATFLSQLLTPALAEEGQWVGYPFTSEHAADAMDIQRVVDSMSNALDAKNWILLRSLTTDQMEVSLNGSELTTVSANDLIGEWETRLGREELISHHMRSNQQVRFDGPDRATMHSQGVILYLTHPNGTDANQLLREYWSIYKHGMIRTADGWKVTRMIGNPLVSRDTSLPSKN